MKRLAAFARVVLLAAGLVLACAAPGRAQSGSGGGNGGESGSLGSGLGTPAGGLAGAEGNRLGAAPGLTEEFAQGMLPLRAGILSLPGPVDANLYVVGPGDLLQLLLWGKVSRTLPLEVGPEGNVLLPGAGTLVVSGETLTEVRAKVLARMRNEFRGVNMDLRLVRPRTFRVYLTGQVRQPGPIDATGVHRVADVLTPGMLLDDASQRRIEVLHRDGTRQIADLQLFLRAGDASGNPALRDGDVLNVPVATDWVYAEGALARPGRVELGMNDSLLTLFRMAGDPTPAADADRALLIRFPRPFQAESLWFSLGDAYGRVQNPQLKEGDRLYVYYIPQYHLQLEVGVVGEVARPGVYPITEGRHHLSDIVAAAGGFLAGADLSAIRVHRQSPNTGERDPELDRLLRLSRNDLTSTEYEIMRTRLASMKEYFRVDWNRLVANKTDLDLLMRSGDIIRVERLVPSIRVEGEVRRPGILGYQTGLETRDYVQRAGGYTDRAWSSRVRVTRAVTGQTLLARNVGTLDPGDIIWVPEKPDPNYGRTFQDFLLISAQIATIALAIVTIRRY